MKDIPNLKPGHLKPFTDGISAIKESLRGTYGTPPEIKWCQPAFGFTDIFDGYWGNCFSVDGSTFRTCRF
jgi:hypothetical protein